MAFRDKPSGWRNESYRHYLAAKGITSKSYLARSRWPVATTIDGKEAVVDTRKRLGKTPLPIEPVAYEQGNQNFPEEQKEGLKTFVLRDSRGNPIARRQLLLSGGRRLVSEGAQGFERGDPLLKVEMIKKNPIYFKEAKGERVRTTYVNPNEVLGLVNADGDPAILDQEVLYNGKKFKIDKYDVVDGTPLIDLKNEAGEQVVAVDPLAVHSIKKKEEKPKNKIVAEEAEEEMYAKKMHDWAELKKTSTPQEYILVNVESEHTPNEKVRNWNNSIRHQIAHPVKDMDEEWSEYTRVADNKYYGPKGKSERLSKNKWQRAEQRGAATFGRVITQSNVEPLIDDEKNRNLRQSTGDLIFGRRSK